MSSFNEPLTVTKLGNGKWRVARSFRYYVGNLGSDNFIDVPKGLETDFASVPKGLWNILPPDGEYTQAAVLHDFLYQTKGENGKRTRKECDEIFLEGMKVLGVPWWKRKLMFTAVRIFGSAFF